MAKDKSIMIYDKILSNCRKGKRQFVVLIDPEKSEPDHLSKLLGEINASAVDFILLGGSTGESSADAVLKSIRLQTDKDVVLFPGDVSHLTKGVDAIFFLSLLSGRNPDYLIGNHVKAIPFLQEEEIIPVAYILIDGAHISSTELVSQTKPMSTDDVLAIVHTAKAGELLGHKMVYLEAGSGASSSVPSTIVKAVRASVSIPLVVGGGITTNADVKRLYDAGADVVVVGNLLERSPHLLSQLF